MNKLITSTIAVVFGLLLCAPAQAQDDDASAEEQFSGTYTLSVPQKKARASVNQKIEKLVDDMNFIKRPFARSSLKGTTEPCAKLTLAFPSDEVSVKCHGKPVTVSPDDGTQAPYKSDDGTTYQVRQEIEGSSLTQFFKGEDGTRTNTYTLSNGGDTLNLAVKIESDQLPRPLQYELSFKRASSK